MDSISRDQAIRLLASIGLDFNDQALSVTEPPGEVLPDDRVLGELTDPEIRRPFSFCVILLSLSGKAQTSPREVAASLPQVHTPQEFKALEQARVELTGQIHQFSQTQTAIMRIFRDVVRRIIPWNIRAECPPERWDFRKGWKFVLKKAEIILVS